MRGGSTSRDGGGAIHCRIKEKGILSGKRVERRESGDAREFAKLEQMSAEELIAFLRQQEGAA
jgi:hypothetical protein